MYKLTTAVLLLLLSLSGFKPLLADGWVLKSDDYLLARDLFEQTLQVRGFKTKSLSAKQQQALLQELFIRENLLLQQDKVPAAALAEFNEKLQEYRRNQLARLTLDSLVDAGMPDFSQRAKELYEVRKQEQYQLPLRLRVRILRQSTMSDGTGANLQRILAKIKAGELGFKQAVMQYSDDPRRTLNGGDSFWFQRGQKADVIFNAAQALSAEQPLSDVFIHEDIAYILQFIGRQEPIQQPFAEVKDSILTELQAAYREEQRKLLLTELRDRFQNNTEIHPDFQ